MAVLPFINNSPDAENAYFSNGTMEAIHNHLCKIKDLRVVSRTSVEAYRNKPIPIPTIAEEKQVSYVLEGSMQKYGNKLRLTVTLFDANDRNLWSQLYNREIIQIEDLLSLQSEIAQMVAAEIEAVITPEEKSRIEKVPTRSLMAYDFYQRGLEEQNNAGRASQKKEFLEKAKEYYHLALDNDVTFAKAYAGLASIYWQQQFWLQYFSENSMDSVLILADLALTYDNTLAEAYTLKGRYFNHIGDTTRALEELNKAILFNPNDWQAYLEKSSVVLDYVQKIESLHHAIFRCRDASLQFLLLQLWRTYLDMGFTEEAKHYMQESFTLGKDSAFIYGSLAWYEYAVGNYPAAADYMDKCIKLDSAYLEFLGWHEIYINAGQDEKAYQTYKKLLALNKNSVEVQIHTTHRIGYAFWKTGHYEEADYYFDLQIKYCEESIKLNRQFAIDKHAHYNLAAVYAFLGDKEKAYNYLEEFEQRDFIAFWEFIIMKKDRLFENLRGEERYERFLQTIESKYQTEHERVRKRLEELDLLQSTPVN
jgi:TolB-like protein/Tfp pilus assembly protein PilF